MKGRFNVLGIGKDFLRMCQNVPAKREMVNVFDYNKNDNFCSSKDIKMEKQDT